MVYSRLYFFVEGDDDERFMRGVICPQLGQTYSTTEVVKYRGLKRSKIEGYLRGIDSMNSPDLHAEYLYLADLDEAASILIKKARIKEQLPRINEDRIVVVGREIESWYLAGLDRAACERLGLRHIASTDDVTKEQFDQWMPTRFRSRIDFMSEILKEFSISTAREKNQSFHYLVDLLGL